MMVYKITYKQKFSKPERSLYEYLESYKEKIGIRFLEYALYVEYGTKPHYVPKWIVINKIKPWVMIKMGITDDKKATNTAWAVAKNIELNGTRRRPFIRPAVVWMESVIPELLKEGKTLRDIAEMTRDEMRENLIDNDSYATGNLHDFIEIYEIWKRKPRK